MEIIIIALVAILMYYILVYLTTKLYIKKVKKELDTKFKRVVTFLIISTIYIIFTFVSVKIYNYASAEVITDSNVSWITIGWPSVQFSSASVLIATIFQTLISIIYVYLVTMFVKSNINNKFKRNMYMIVFYICGLASVIILSFGYYGFLQGNLYHHEILKFISNFTILSTIILYPILMYKDILLKKCK